MRFYLERYPTDNNPAPILTPRKNIAWEANAVFNPSVVYDNGIFRMLYRTYSNTLKVTAPNLHQPGSHLEGNASFIGYAESRDGVHFERREEPFIAPDREFDRYGCEDPRVTKIGDTFYILYTAIDAPFGSERKTGRNNCHIALSSTKDFKTVSKHGIVGPRARSKAGALFPEPVNGGRIGLLLTLASDSEQSRVVLRYYDSLEELLDASSAGWDAFLAESTSVLQTQRWLHRGPELGAAPIKTERGWLLLFSAESMSDTWTISAALLDLEQPHKLIARAPGYLLQAVTPYEREGFIPNVTFPEGAVIVGNELFVYYGCADTVIGLARCKLNELLDYFDSSMVG